MISELVWFLVGVIVTATMIVIAMPLIESSLTIDGPTIELRDVPRSRCAEVPSHMNK